MKGGSTNLVHSRSLATEKRKRTLLLEYKQARGCFSALPAACETSQHGKAGGFIDRRFGEQDATLDADEKALRRMQRLRSMQFGKASRFALAGVPRSEATALRTYR